MRKYFFHDRIVDEWNNLPSEAVIVKTMNRLKAKIDKASEEGGASNEPAKAYPKPTT